MNRDPEFVPALCLLANTRLYLLWLNDRSAPHLDLAKKALEAAARLQPDSGDVHFTRGLLYYRGSRDYGPALAEFALAQRSSPNDASAPFLIGMVERRQGRWEQCLQHIQVLQPHLINLAALSIKQPKGMRRLLGHHIPHEFIDMIPEQPGVGDFKISLYSAFESFNYE